MVVNISSSIDCCGVIVDDFHEASSVFAQIEMLFWVRVNIPFKLIQFVSNLLSKQLKEEMEAHCTLAHILSVFMHLELHNLEVEEVGFLLRIEHFDIDFVISRLEKAMTELLDTFICLSASVLISSFSLFQHSIEKNLIVSKICLVI